MIMIMHVDANMALMAHDSVDVMIHLCRDLSVSQEP